MVIKLSQINSMLANLACKNSFVLPRILKHIDMITGRYIEALKCIPGIL